jgi:hypothetical protein
VLSAALALVACASDGDDDPTEPEYLEALQRICAATTATLAQLPEPPDQISIADFAADVASALTDEAEQIRQLDPPDELDDDHRAIIANTDDQADAWDTLGATPDTDAEGLAEASARVAELTLGRSDLAAEIGADDCVRAPG